MQDFLDWLGGHVNWVLVAALLAVGGTYAFIAIADRVELGRTQHFDDWAIRELRRPDNPALARGPVWMTEVARDLTALGGVAVLSLATVAVVGFLLLNGKYGAALLVAVATGGGLGLSMGLKHLIDRPRPELVPHLSMVYTSSFPSGHSMLSATVYLTLGSLLARLTPRRRDKLYFVAVAAVLTILVGVSRVYMGVHYPTDVLAGWMAGLVWALLCWLTTRSLQRHGAVERDTDVPSSPS